MKRRYFLIIFGLMAEPLVGNPDQSLSIWTSSDGRILQAKGVSWKEGGVSVLPANKKKEILLPFAKLAPSDVKKAMASLPFYVNDRASLYAKTVGVSTQRQERETGDYLAYANLYSYDGYNFQGDVVVTPVTEKYKLSGRTVEVKLSSIKGDGVAGVEFFALKGDSNNREVYTIQTAVVPFRQNGTIQHFSAKPVEDFQGWVVVVRSPNTGKIIKVGSSARHLEGDLIPRLPKVVKFKTDFAPIKEKVLKELGERKDTSRSDVQTETK